MKTKILDTTIRDGSYAVDFKYTKTDVRNIVQRLVKLGVEYIELGHGMGLNASSLKFGESLYPDEEYIDVAKSSCSDRKIGVFCIPGIAKIENLYMAKEHGVDFVRIGVPVEDVETALPYLRAVKANNMTAMVNFMKSYAASEEAFAESSLTVFNEGADCVYLVDSAGYMLPEEIESFRNSVLSICPKACMGFHGHNNMGMGVANALKCVELGFDFIDCSFQGIGRSIGNVPMEKFVMAAKRKFGDDVIEIDIPRLLEYGYASLKELSSHSLDNPLDLICGYSGFHSSFLKDIYKCCEEFNVDPLRLIMAYSEYSKVVLDYDVLCEFAKTLPSDNVDDHPYNFRSYFNNI